MGKTRKEEQVQNIDPALRREAAALMEMFRTVASQPKEWYEQPTVAGFTPKQESAFSMGDAAAEAFGFAPSSGRPAMPAMTTAPSGLSGYAPAGDARAEYDGSSQQWLNALKSFFKQMGTIVPDQGPVKTSGGKK